MKATSLALATAGAALAVGIAWIAARSAGAPDGAPAAPSFAAHTGAAAAAQRDPEERRRSDALAAALARIESRLERLEARAAEPPIASEPRPPEPAEGDAVESPPDEEASRLDRERRLAALDERLSLEPPDVNRSLELEDAMRQGFDDSGIDSRALREASCSTSLCRLEFAFDDEAARDEAVSQLLHFVPWEFDGYGTADPDDVRRMVVYVSQEGEAL